MTAPPDPITRNSCAPGCTERNSNVPSGCTTAVSGSPAPSDDNSTVMEPTNGVAEEISPWTGNPLRESTPCPRTTAAANAPAPTKRKQVFISPHHATSYLDSGHCSV